MNKKSKKEEVCGCESHSYHHKNYSCGCGGAVYGLGFIGAAIYYVSTATSFLDGSTWSLKSPCLACIFSVSSP